MRTVEPDNFWVGDRARRLWLKLGKPAGRDVEIWEAAKGEIVQELKQNARDAERKKTKEKHRKKRLCLLFWRFVRWL